MADIVLRHTNETKFLLSICSPNTSKFRQTSSKGMECNAKECNVIMTIIKNSPLGKS